MPSQIPYRLNLLSIPLRFFFSLLYHQLAWTYDWVAFTVSTGLWNKWTHLVLQYITGSTILEVGHGPGHLLTSLHQSWNSVMGIDISPHMSRIAYNRLLSKNIPPRLILGEAQNLPFSENILDHIVVTFPSEYIYHPHTLSEAFRVLKPGGTLIIVPFAWITGNKLLHKVARWLFNITGESPRLDLFQFQLLINIGFLATSEKRRLESSTVMIIQAQKPPN